MRSPWRSLRYSANMNFSAVDISYFLEVVKHGNLGRAAAACGVTQPAITKAIRRLEDAAGIPLLERGAHGARLTSEGHLFVESARRFNAQHADMIRTASELRAHHAGLLRIGLTNPSADSEVVWAMADLIRKRPGLRIKLTIGKSDALNAAVEAGELDMAVVPGYPGVSFSCTQLAISEDRAHVAARVGHPVFAIAEPTLQDLSPYAWVMPSRDSASRRVVTAIHERAGVAIPNVALEAEFISDAVLGLVGRTDLLAVVPASNLRSVIGRIMPLPVPALTIERSLVLLTRPQVTWSPLMMALRDLLIAFRTGPAS